MSRSNREEVNQGAVSGSNRALALTFRSYQQSQGGTYECRVAGPENNTESLLVCISEDHMWGECCGVLSIIVLMALPCQFSHIYRFLMSPF